MEGFNDMKRQEKQRKSKSVVLCRSSKKDPDIHSKEIQGLVFDHPSMPKIVTVSSAPQKPSTRNPSGDRVPGLHLREQYPTGYYEQTTGHCTPEQRSTGHAPKQYVTGQSPPTQKPTSQYTPEQYPSGQYRPAQNPTGHFTPEQNPTGHLVPEQHHPRSSPPPLIHTPTQHSTRQQIPGSFRQYQSFPSGAKPAEGAREASVHGFDSQGERSEIRFPFYYRQSSAPPGTIPSSPTVHRGRLFQHRVTSSQPHTEQAAVRRNSTGALRYRLGNGVQYSVHGVQRSEDIRQHSANVGQHLGNTEGQYPERGLIELGTDQFSRDFHLRVWRESHDQAVRNLIPPVRELDQPLHLPQTTGHGGTTVPSPRYRSSTDDSRFSYQVDQRAHPQQVGAPTSSNPPPPLSDPLKHGQYELRSIRRSSSNEPGSLHTEIGTEDWSLINSNPVVRNSERNNSEISNAWNQRTSSDVSEGCSPVVRSTEEKNSEAPNTGSISQTDNIRRRQTRQTRQRKRQKSPTVVVISDSDEEEMQVLSPLLSDDSEVFAVSPETGVHNRGVETNCVVRESLSSKLLNGSSSESEAACYITKVKKPKEKNEDLVRSKNEMLSNEPRIGGASHDACAYDVNNNEESNEKEMETSYRSVLYEREMEGHSSTQSVIMSEQLLFDKDNRGTKRTRRDEADYFVAGQAETAGSALDAMASKIRRVSSDELNRNSKTRQFCYQSLQGNRDCVRSQETSSPKAHEDVPKYERSWSEIDEQNTTQNFETDHSISPTHKGIHSESQRRKMNANINTSDFKKCEEMQRNAPKAKQTKSHCDECLDHRRLLVAVPGISPKTGASSVTTQDEFRCRSCDRVLTENQSSGKEGSQSMVKLPKASQKPTGIVVGVKQLPEARQALESSNLGSEKPGNDSGIMSTEDVIRDHPKSLKDHKGDDLDILHFRVVRKDADVTWTNGKTHLKSIPSPRDQVVPSQQWEAYSLKLEKERIAKETFEKTEKTPDQEQAVANRNSWEELNKKFESERTNFSESKRMTFSDISIEKQREDVTRKRIRSYDNEFETSHKSYKFHDASNSIAEEYKREKLSDVSDSEDLTVSESRETLETQNHDPNTKVIPKNCELFLVSQDNNSRCLISTNYPMSLEEAAIEIDNLVNIPNTQGLRPSEVISSEKRPSKLRPLLVKPPGIGLLEENSSNVDTVGKYSSEKEVTEAQSREVLSSEVEPTGISSPVDEPQAAKSPPPKEELSLREWIEILQGRIQQVKESIDEEMTPWKTKNKKKVLEKLEHNLTWITGPDVDEAMFISRRLQFFQTMKKQYDLMNKIKTQRQAMKTTDSSSQAVENAEKLKAAKEVEVSLETEEIKKSVKCKPKSVKNNGRGLMKKIRKSSVVLN